MFKHICLCLGLIVAQLAPAAADDYPARTVQLVVTVEPGGTADQGRRQREVAGAAEDDGRRLNQFACRGVQSFDTILADPDDGQPWLYCGSLRAVDFSE